MCLGQLECCHDDGAAEQAAAGEEEGTVKRSQVKAIIQIAVVRHELWVTAVRQGEDGDEWLVQMTPGIHEPDVYTFESGDDALAWMAQFPEIGEE